MLPRLASTRIALPLLPQTVIINHAPTYIHTYIPDTYNQKTEKIGGNGELPDTWTAAIQSGIEKSDILFALLLGVGERKINFYPNRIEIPLKI